MQKTVTVTVRSLIGGFILAIVMAAVNSYLTLKVGIIEEGPIITMMLFTGVMMAFGKKVSSQEAVMVATMGSAGGSFGFIANFYGAFALIGRPLTWSQMVIFPVLTSFVGLMAAIPLRQLFVVDDPLPWPTSKAAVAAIQAVTGEGGGRQTKLLFLFTGIAGLYVFLSGGLHWFPEMTMVGFLGLSAHGVGVAWSPFIIGAGYLIGMRVGYGFLAGAIVLAILSPHLPVPNKPHLFIWPGVMFLVSSGLTVLALNYKTILRAMSSIFVVRKSQSGADSEEGLDRVMNPRWFKIIAVIVVLTAVVLLSTLFHVVFYITLTMLVFGGIIFNLVATRAGGETGFNPVRVMGVMLQGVSALLGGSSAQINLTGAGFAGASIGQTSILVQDNYFGRYFKIPARWQWLAQLTVLVPVALVSAYVFSKVNAAYPLQMEGSGGLPAPVAKMWAAMALVFSGQSVLPKHAVSAMWIGGLAGVVFAGIDTWVSLRLKAAAAQGKRSLLRFVPHSTGLGIALIIPIAYSCSFFLGAIVLCAVLPKIFKTKEDTLNSMAAAGIVGEGVVGLIVAILVAAGLLSS